MTKREPTAKMLALKLRYLAEKAARSKQKGPQALCTVEDWQPDESVTDDIVWPATAPYTKGF